MPQDELVNVLETERENVKISMIRAPAGPDRRKTVVGLMAMAPEIADSCKANVELFYHDDLPGLGRVELSKLDKVSIIPENAYGVAVFDVPWAMVDFIRFEVYKAYKQFELHLDDRVAPAIAAAGPDGIPG